MLETFIALVCVGCEPPWCFVRTNLDPYAKSRLSQYTAKLPYESGFVLFCNATQTPPVTYDLFRTSWTTTNDPCSLAWPSGTGMDAAAHTHPWFSTAAEFKAGTGCLGDKSTLTAAQLDTLNTVTNADFSTADKQFVINQRKSLYMRVPSGTVYKVRYIRTTDGAYLTATI